MIEFIIFKNMILIIIKVLIYNQASPWSNQYYDLKEISNDETLLSLLKLARQA